jgi:hypothetical protein
VVFTIDSSGAQPERSRPPRNSHPWQLRQFSLPHTTGIFARPIVCGFTYTSTARANTLPALAKAGAKLRPTGWFAKVICRACWPQMEFAIGTIGTDQRGQQSRACNIVTSQLATLNLQ